jgi:WD40 repeat protein
VATLGPAASTSKDPVLLIAPNPDGESVAIVRNASRIVSVWNVEARTVAFDYDTRIEPITGIGWSSDGRYLAVSSYDGSLHVLDADHGGRGAIVGYEPQPQAIQSLAFAPDGRTIATATFNSEQPDTNHVSIWDWKAKKVVRELDAVGATSLAFDRAGERLAIGYSDGRVEIRDASTGEVERSFRAGSVTLMNVVFSPDGGTLATSGEDATIRLFDTEAETGAQQLVLRGHGFLVSGLDFSPDGSRLVSSSPDGLVRVWALDLDELIRIARENVTRELSDDECRQYLHEPNGCA